MSIASDSQTIFARATAQGRAGVAIIRISGEHALEALRHFGYVKTPAPRQAILHRFTVGEVFIDAGLILYFKAPHSFTGEDVVELQLHGGTAIVNRVMKELTALPHFRLANPGEFSHRAFLNQKMDLAEAEGLVDMINAETELQRKQASQLMQGHASDFFHDLRARILEPMALLEAYIDFPEEEIPEEVSSQIDGKIESLKADIRYQLDSGASAERLRQGFTVLLIGKPNSGKSSLLNAIVKREAAIVTDIAGTTRDMIEVFCEVDGIPVTLIDTAGIRDSEDQIEQMGVSRALERAKEADLVLHLVDGGEGALPSLDVSCHQIVTLVVATKADLFPAPVFEYDHLLCTHKAVSVKSLTDAMAEHLKKKIPPADCFALHERHRSLLIQALKGLEQFEESPILEIKAEHLRFAAESLTEIIGAHGVEDLLDIIFSTFCIGK